MAEKPSKLQAPPRKLSARVIAFVAIIIIGSSIGYLFLVREGVPGEGTGAIKVGENMTYSVWLGENLVGTAIMRVDNLENYQGARCYKARYAQTSGNIGVLEDIFFDEQGRLRYYITERGYVGATGIENAEWIIEDNIDLIQGKIHVKTHLPGPILLENDIAMPAALTTTVQLRYALRLEKLELGYSKLFNLTPHGWRQIAYDNYRLLFPDATRSTLLTVRVIGDERIEVPAGSFDCWLAEGTAEDLTLKLWVSKDGRAVPRVYEITPNYTWKYILEYFSTFKAG